MSIAEVGSIPGIVRLERTTIADVDLRQAELSELAPSGCVFEKCDFRGVTFDRRTRPIFRARERNVFHECRFDGVDLRAIDPGASRFERCSFDRADITRWNVTTAEFVDCRFAGTVQDVRFYGRPWGPTAATLEPPRAANEFRGNDFREADLVRVAFLMGIDVRKQRWPESGDYVRLDRIHQRLTRARAGILGWKDLEARNEALAMLRALSFLYVQQEEIVARRVEPGTSTPAEIQSRVWEALAATL